MTCEQYFQVAETTMYATMYVLLLLCAAAAGYLIGRRNDDLQL